MTTVNRLHFQSKVLGHAITLDSLDDIPKDDLVDVSAEVATALRELNLEVKRLGGLARSRKQYLHPQDWTDIHSRRAYLADLHQKLLRLGKQHRIAENQRQQQARDASLAPDLSDFFQQVVRSEANRTDYQRWILQAEIRRAAWRPDTAT